MNNEQQTDAGMAKTPAGSNNDDRNKSSVPSLIEQANAAAERLEKANEEKALLLAREERLEARRIVSGESAGAQPAVPKRPLSNLEYARALAATGRVPQDP